MSKNIIDARGLPCPQPVILTRKALKENPQLTIIVDNETALRNVSLMAEKSGFRVAYEKRTDGIYLDVSGDRVIKDEQEDARNPKTGALVLTVSGETMGRGDEELGGILVRTFFHTLGEVQPVPDIIVFFNGGVKLTVEGSPVLEDLKALAAKGKKILVCGTCLGHFGLKEKIAVGEISNMYAIAETWLRAGKTVSL